AIRCPDPFYRPGPKWVARRLAPHCSRVELSSLKDAGDAERLLRSMGAEVANVHLGTPDAAAPILADLARRPDGWLKTAARGLADLIEQDWEAWRAAPASRATTGPTGPPDGRS